MFSSIAAKIVPKYMNVIESSEGGGLTQLWGMGVGNDGELMALHTDTHANHFALHASVLAGLVWLGLHHM